MFEGLFQPLHLVILLVIVLLIFGPGKLPQLGGSIGRTIKEFKQGINEVGHATPVEQTTPAQTVITTVAMSETSPSTVVSSSNSDEYEVIERKVTRVAKQPVEAK